MARLTNKQARFVEEYLVDLNATAAAGRAGYRDPNIGRQLITKNNVSAAIAEAMKKRSERTGITADRVVQELALVAFAVYTDYVRVVSNGQGYQTVQLIDTEQLTKGQRAAISGIRETKYGIEVNSYDKLRALELLGRHLGIFQKEERRDKEDAAENEEGVVMLPAVAPQQDESEGDE